MVEGYIIRRVRICDETRALTWSRIYISSKIMDHLFKMFDQTIYLKKDIKIE